MNENMERFLITMTGQVAQHSWASDRDKLAGYLTAVIATLTTDALSWDWAHSRAGRYAWRDIPVWRDERYTLRNLRAMARGDAPVVRVVNIPVGSEIETAPYRYRYRISGYGDFVDAQPTGLHRRTATHWGTGCAICSIPSHVTTRDDIRDWISSRLERVSPERFAAAVAEKTRHQQINGGAPWPNVTC